jgi:hypothetical protein
MRFTLPLLLGAGLLAAGCTAEPVPAEKSVKEKEEARATEVASLKGWDKLWSAPDAAIGAANQFGFRATPYASVGEGWRSTGGPVMIAGSAAEKPNRVAFTAEGPSDTQIDTLTFDLTLSDTGSAEDARKRFAKLVRDFLFRAGIDGAALIPAIEQGTPTRGTLSDTPYSIEKLNSVDDSEDHLAVTFIRSGANAPNLSKPQGN